MSLIGPESHSHKNFSLCTRVCPSAQSLVPSAQCPQMPDAMGDFCPTPMVSWMILVVWVASAFGSIVFSDQCSVMPAAS